MQALPSSPSAGANALSTVTDPRATAAASAFSNSFAKSEGSDQTSGWKDRAYIIEVKPQNGPLMTEEYTLSPDGRELLMKLHIGASELPAVILTRVYRPADQSASQPLPVSD